MQHDFFDQHTERFNKYKFSHPSINSYTHTTENKY
jgi:hypothetical protein